MSKFSIGKTLDSLLPGAAFVEKKRLMGYASTLSYPMSALM